jgi:hypothetical protein
MSASDPVAALLDPQWREQIVFATPAPGVELGIGEYRLPPDVEIPLFAREVDTAVGDEGVDWAAVAEAMVYVLAHAPTGPHVTFYCSFLDIWQPDVCAYLTQQGVGLAAEGQFVDGLICLRAATIISPMDPLAQYNLGVCCREYGRHLAAAGRPEPAEQAEAAARLALRKAVVLDPSLEASFQSVLS